MFGAIGLGRLGEDHGAAVAHQEIARRAQRRVRGHAGIAVGTAALQGHRQLACRYRFALHFIRIGQRFAYESDAGFDGVFMTEANNDSLACSLGLGFNTSRIKLGTAITNIYLRHPNLLANEVAALHEFTGGRFILGLGTGHRSANASLGIDMGAPSEPMKKMRDTVASLRKMLDGGRTNPKITGKQQIFLAGVSRPMVRLAGEIDIGQAPQHGGRKFRIARMVRDRYHLRLSNWPDLKFL